MEEGLAISSRLSYNRVKFEVQITVQHGGQTRCMGTERWYEFTLFLVFSIYFSVMEFGALGGNSVYHSKRSGEHCLSTVIVKGVQ